MVVDGLRFDYLLNYDNLEHDEKLRANKFKQLNQAIFSEPEKFSVFRAHSDFPTLTIMRVPCMMTGNIPQRANIVTSFGPVSTREDSVLKQMYLANQKSFLAGDNPLFYYFKDYITYVTKPNAFFFDNRNSRVDEPTHEALKKKIAEGGFDMFAAHVLRADHMGHAHTLYGNEVSLAIDDLDQLIMDTIATIDDDTILLVAGDHGMTTTGNHGGSTIDETSTAIFAYFKKGFMKYKNNDSNIKKVMRSVNETNAQMKQAVLAPTLSMLTGTPIPFSSMGQILSDLYPVGDYYPVVEKCPEAGFVMQMLNDNHLNSLQILNYFEKYQKVQHLFSKEQYTKVKNLAEEIRISYKKAQEMIDNSQQCEESFNEIAASAIVKSQELSEVIYEMTDKTVPYEFTIFGQGFTLLFILAGAYVLLIQYLYMSKDYESITLSQIKPKQLLDILKKVATLIVMLALIWGVMLAYNAKRMHPVTTSVFLIACWMLGSALLFFYLRNKESQKQQPEIESAAVPIESSSLETEQVLQNRSNPVGFLWIFENPRILAAMVGIFGFLFYLIHAYNIDREKFNKFHGLNPYVFIFLIAAKVYGSYPAISYYIFATAATVSAVIYLLNFSMFWSKTSVIVMGLFLLGDWLYGEMKFAEKRLKMNKIWSKQYILAFLVLVIYHLLPDRDADFTVIILPRMIWTICLGSLLASVFLRMGREAIRRNFQVNFVLFMALVQVPTRLLYFAMVLSVMRIINHLFKKANVKNYLYPVILSFVGYMGLFMLNYTDRKLPDSFNAAFVGLRDFHLVFSMVFYLSSMLSTIILGLMFISFYDQDFQHSQSEEVDLDVVKGEDFMLRSNSKIIKKRNLIMYGFLFNLVMISASIKNIVYLDDLRAEGVMQKFMVDGVLYAFVSVSIYIML